jgi:hypothetical protein
VATQTEEFAADLPVFEEQQPLRRPRDNGRRDGVFRRPEHLLRIVEAQGRPLRTLLVPVDVRQEFLLLNRFGTDGRVDDMDGHVRILERPSVEDRSPEVDDPDPVGLAGRLDRTLPDPDPSGLGLQLEVRKEAPDRGVLLIDA